MNTVTREAVGRIARALITLNDSTTTLDVKNALRAKGFWATQATIREFMLDITSKDGDIQYDDSNAMYRVYTFTSPWARIRLDDDDEDDDDDLTTSVALPTPTNGLWSTSQANTQPITVTVTHTTPVSRVHPDDVPADYLVTTNDSRFPHVFQNVTRGEAKHKWALLTGKPYKDARTTKMSGEE